MLERLLRTADVLVENFTPRVMEQFGFDWDRVHALNDELIMVRMPAFGLDGPWRDRTGFAQTMECLTGMSWLTGFAEGPPVLVRGACDPLAGMHAAFATMLALIARDGHGGGRLVEAAMVESVLNAAAEQVVEYSSSGTLLGRDGNRGPSAAPQGVYPCAGDDEWIAVAVASDEQWRSLRALLGNPSWMRNDDFSVAAGRRAAHDAIDRELSSWTRQHPAEETVQMFLDAGIPSAVVIPPRDIAANPQLRHRRLFEVEHHPVTGDHEVPTLPFRFSRVDHWLRSPAPTLGRDNDSVLEELGYSRRREATLARGGPRWCNAHGPITSMERGHSSCGAISIAVFTTMPPPRQPSGSRPYQSGTEQPHRRRSLVSAPCSQPVKPAPESSARPPWDRVPAVG